MLHPTRKYIYIAIKQKGVLEALAILKYEVGNIHWVDLVWDGRNRDILKSLERKVWILALLLGAGIVEMWLNNDDEARDILLSAAMKTKENPYDLFFSSRSFDPDLDGEDTTRRLYFTMCDSDIF